jgi:dTDP-4-amino-4,6-dideoxygalactose transaminase
MAVGVGRGDEVITVSHSFIATASAVRYCGAIPVFVDVQSETGNMDPHRIANACSPRTKAILCVHQLGMPCDLAAIVSIAVAHGLPVVEDAACAVGSEILWNDRWERVGRPHGDVACFSFHPRKLLSTGDGGMVTTSKAELDAVFRLLRQHGMSVPDAVRHDSEKVVTESYRVLGYNYRLTDIQAAIGREQLKRVPAMVMRRRELVERYQRSLATLAGVVTPSEPTWARSNWQSYAVRLRSPLRQSTVMQRMLAEGIATRRGVMNAHQEVSYPPDTWRGASGALGNSEEIFATSLVLPLFHEMTALEQDRVVTALAMACQ